MEGKGTFSGILQERDFGGAVGFMCTRTHEGIVTRNIFRVRTDCSVSQGHRSESVAFDMSQKIFL